MPTVSRRGALFAVKPSVLASGVDAVRARMYGLVFGAVWALGCSGDGAVATGDLEADYLLYAQATCRAYLTCCAAHGVADSEDLPFRAVAGIRVF